MCHQTTFFVPVERVALPATDTKRWLILPVTAIGPFQAIKQATRIATDLRLTGVAVWAAVKDCPTFHEMQALREGQDAARARARMPRAQRMMVAA